jgi:NADH-quinone oxidoreductase subunit N
MTLTDLVTLSPLIVLSATAIVVMLVIAFYRNHMLSALLTLLGLILSFIALWISASTAAPQVTPLLILDGYALFYIGLLLAATFVVAVLSYGYLERRAGNHEEFYVLLLLATLGSSVLAASTHFASFFLGLEILSVSLYGLIAYLRLSEHAIEAGIKYLVLAASSAAFLLFGMALVYAQTGTMEFARMASLRTTPGNLQNALLLAGFGMLVIGIGFKLAVVPFHMWTPDVYQGAPAPVTGFVATVSKGGMFALLLRYFTQVDVHAFSSLFVLFTVIAIATMFIGNLLALLQNNVKRILAYSSIAHFGYLLVAFLSSGAYAVTAVTFYLAAYFVTTLGAFGIVSVLSGPGRDADTMDDYRGLSFRRPWLAGIFTSVLLSLASIPMTAGFIGKFYILRAGVGSALWLLVLILVVSSAIGLYYYLRIVVAIFAHPSQEGQGLLAAPSLPLAAGLVLAALVVLVFGLGVYPTPLIEVIQATVAGLI